MDFVAFSAAARVFAILWSMWSAGERPAVVLPEPVNQFETAFPSIDPDGHVRCTKHYQDCRVQDETIR